MDTGWKSPTATGGTHNEWVNPTNAYSSNNQYAERESISGAGYYQSYEDFGFGIPGGATINGIEVSIEHYEDDITWNTLRIYVFESSTSSTFYKSFNKSTTETTQTVGSSSDLWGGSSWTSTDFSNANFYAEFFIGGYFGHTGTFYLDHLQVKVYYTEASTFSPLPTFRRP